MMPRKQSLGCVAGCCQQFREDFLLTVIFMNAKMEIETRIWGSCHGLWSSGNDKCISVLIRQSYFEKFTSMGFSILYTQFCLRHQHKLNPVACPKNCGAQRVSLLKGSHLVLLAFQRDIKPIWWTEEPKANCA